MDLYVRIHIISVGAYALLLRLYVHVRNELPPFVHNTHEKRVAFGRTNYFWGAELPLPNSIIFVC